MKTSILFFRKKKENLYEYNYFYDLTYMTLRILCLFVMEILIYVCNLLF